MNSDEIAKRLRAANHDGGMIQTHQSDGISYGRWEPRQALDAVIEEVAAILAEQAAEIAALKANAHYHGGERENP
jgi:hypothetical protein